VTGSPSGGEARRIGASSVRVAAVLCASLALHAGAWQSLVLLTGPPEPGGTAGAPPAAVAALEVRLAAPPAPRPATVPDAVPTAGLPRGTEGTKSRAASTVANADAPRHEAPGTPGSSDREEAAGARRPAFRSPAPAGAPANAAAVAGTDTVAAVAQRPEPSATLFHERWEVDREPEFAYPPLGLDELPARLGRAVRATVSLWVDARGALVALDARADPPVEGISDAALRDAIAESFAPVSFLPGRLDGRAVPVVKRYELQLDPGAPIALGFGMVN